MSEWRTLHQFKGKLTITREERDGNVHFTIAENERKIVNASGKTDQEAAAWLVRHVNRLARQTEDLVEQAGLLTVEEIDTAVLEDTARANDETR